MKGELKGGLILGVEPLLSDWIGVGGWRQWAGR